MLDNNNKKIKKKRELKSIQNLQDTIKLSNIQNLGVFERTWKSKGLQNLVNKITAQNFPNLVENMDKKNVNDIGSSKDLIYNMKCYSQKFTIKM